ncbi:MAG TPA: PIN domain-containing protein [Thermoanaerobaculia bacterium]|nr:PIN domain-containing protein [Thermoanaerobaculia bacterium]
MSQVLFDTNVLVYAHDPRDPAKQARAILALDHVHASGQGRLSTQILAEFFCIATKGTRPLIRRADAARQVERLTRAWPVLDVTSMVVLEALRGVTSHQMSYWDAQLWATARLNQVQIIFSEDFSTGSMIEGVRFVNPLIDEFDAAAWI